MQGHVSYYLTPNEILCCTRLLKMYYLLLASVIKHSETGPTSVCVTEVLPEAWVWGGQGECRIGEWRGRSLCPLGRNVLKVSWEPSDFQLFLLLSVTWTFRSSTVSLSVCQEYPVPPPFILDYVGFSTLKIDNRNENKSLQRDLNWTQESDSWNPVALVNRHLSFMPVSPGRFISEPSDWSYCNTDRYSVPWYF